MSETKTQLKALPKGIALGVQLDSTEKVMHISAIYSPGVKIKSGKLEQWVFWEVTRHLTSDAAQVWKAVGYRTLDCGLRVPIQLRAFGLKGGIAASSLSDLLEGLGLSHIGKRKPNMGMANLQDFSTGLHESMNEVRALEWYFDHELALKCEAERVMQ